MGKPNRSAKKDTRNLTHKTETRHLILDSILRKYSLQNITKNTNITGASGSMKSFICHNIFKESSSNILIILNNKESAAYFLNDLEFVSNNSKKILFFPDSNLKPYKTQSIDNANIIKRFSSIRELNNDKNIIISYPEAIFELIKNQKELNQNTIKLSNNLTQDLDKLVRKLFEFSYEKVDFVSSPGEFSLRGGIIDIYSFSNEIPFRIEFFGEQIEEIRAFDIETQLSINTISQIEIISNPQIQSSNSEKKQSIIEILKKEDIIILENKNLISDSINKLFEQSITAFENLDSPTNHAKPRELFLDKKLFLEQIKTRTIVQFDENQTTAQNIKFSSEPQPSFNKNFDILCKKLSENTQNNIQNIVVCNSEKQKDRLSEIIKTIDSNISFSTIIGNIHSGFTDFTNKIAVYTDHQIFGRYHKYKIKNQLLKKQNIALKELDSLQIGDFVSHETHGVGRFAGLQKIIINDKKQEVIKIVYKDNGILHVGIHSLYKISKFRSKDGIEPKINKLGSPAWKLLKKKTKTKVKKIAFDLIKLYAKRKSKKGFAFSPDTYLQSELESSFIYEDTPDQITSTIDVKKDMESHTHMDRLICGDVGFGKTEVAIRAAFKAVSDNKQVAILVPTTILAFQHYNTFVERLKNFPVNIDYINRFRSAKDKTNIFANLKNGKIDIIIGTHSIVNSKVEYSDLGLLIVDEEHKFGVGIKDKLKTIKENIDTLTLTATPIPRTLQFSLMAARDLSIIKTPPPNRIPVKTQVISFDRTIIRDAIIEELNRDGQVFFIHNRVENIENIANLLKELIPYAKIAIGHGQMEGKKLEQLMIDFANNKYDILVSTTIIESGLDVPNANTIFINDAHRFGMSDIHQMRGRVGRSNKKAFCFLITPPYSAMTEVARKRIETISQFSELGSGFNIAMKDLEIRGAGDLLGAEQSGFISDIGFDSYQKILNETIEELKENEFEELYKHEDKNTGFVKDVNIETDFEIIIPSDYITSIPERLTVYKQLNKVENKEELVELKNNLIDRFGTIPIQLEDLFVTVESKWICKELGFEKVISKNNVLIIYFVKNANSKYFSQDIFHKILQFINQKNSASIKEKLDKTGQNNLSLRFNKKVNSALDIYKILKSINEFVS